MPFTTLTVPALSFSVLMSDQFASSGGVTLYLMSLKSGGREDRAIDLTISLLSVGINVTYVAFHMLSFAAPFCCIYNSSSNN